jgi:hypothetical protein
MSWLLLSLVVASGFLVSIGEWYLALGVIVFTVALFA